MARALEESRVGRPDNVVAGAEWAILSVCDGYKPAQALASALDVAFRTMDRPLHQQLKSGSGSGREPGSASRLQLRDFAVRLVDPKGARPPMTVHLDARFTPETMLRGWAPPPPAPPPMALSTRRSETLACKTPLHRVTVPRQPRLRRHRGAHLGETLDRPSPPPPRRLLPNKPERSTPAGGALSAELPCRTKPTCLYNIKIADR
ncbi:hypothetical protein ACCO45_006115 [Purpureocillium lilacinum]|uniref:Uncharacterized protein n=1 Tax=Purpureocillium lilacinum TaxID=33203 RepID=A0ACC4E0E7_PURLI